MRRTLLAASALFPLTACVTGSHENLNGTAWMQTSAEYVMACGQTYVAAASRLEEALADSTWTAAMEQTGDFSSLPPAIILDVDETVLDNSPYQAWLVRLDTDFQPELWDAWCQDAAAEPIPGAKGFLAAARRQGVEVFYVTNREHKHEARTVANILRVLDPSVTPDKVLCKKENGWSSDKTARRAEVAKTHRVLMLFGDDYNDFTWLGKDTTPGERVKAARSHAGRWGKRWFLLPNPTYGSWERALWDNDYSLSRRAKLDAKRDALISR